MEFKVFNQGNSYIQPYSSALNGSELVTEFNQRSPLNVIGYHTVDLTNYLKGINPNVFDSTDPYAYTAYMTGSRTEDEVKLNISGSSLAISAGECLIAGYYVHIKQAITITLSTLISRSEMGSNMSDEDFVYKYVKITLKTTQGEGNRYDERLTPPLGASFEGVAVNVDNELPTINEYLLGLVIRRPNGNFDVIHNPYRTSIIPITHIAGAEDYDSLVRGTGDPEDSAIYGIKNGEPGNVINISEWLWLSYYSGLGKYLRNFAQVPDDAGIVREGAMLPTIVGKPASEGVDNHVLEMISKDPNHPQDGPKIRYRILKSGQKSPDCYDMQETPLPFANYVGHTATPDDIVSNNGDYNRLQNGYSGIIRPETLWQVDQLWKDRDSLNSGRQWGPFNTVRDAEETLSRIKTQMQRSVPSWDFSVNDYYWVLSDTIPVETGSDQNVSAVYGTVSGKYTTKLTGEVSSYVAGQVTNTIDGEAPIRFTLENGKMGAATVVLPDSSEATIEAGTDITGEGETVAKFNVAGTLGGNCTGDGSGTFSGSIDSFSQNVSSRYVYLQQIVEEGDDAGKLLYWTGPDKTTKTTDVTEWPVLAWTKQAVLRGFATPATENYLGFVKVSPGDKFGDVIRDPETDRLRLSDADIESLNAIRWKAPTGSIYMYQLLPTMTDLMEELSGTSFPGPVHITLAGSGWDPEINKLSRLRGDITIYLGGISNQQEAGSTVLTLEDCSTVRIVAKDSNNNDVDYKVNVTDCTLQQDNFHNINRWISSRFTSGSNTAQLSNPWMVIDKPFTNLLINEDDGNYIQARFVSVTRGEYNITSAEMDIWIKLPDDSSTKSERNLELVSTKNLKFPPLYLGVEESDGTINITNRQDIPTNLNAKISGTGGNHRIYDPQAGEYVNSGSFISTVDWTSGGKFTVSARVLNPSLSTKHGVYDFRFRVLVQFTDVDDTNVRSINYTDLFTEA